MRVARNITIEGQISNPTAIVVGVRAERNHALEIGVAPDADRPGMMLGRPSVAPCCRVEIANDAHQWTYGIARGCPPKAAGVSRSGQRFRRNRPRKGQCGGLENAPGAAAQRGRGARGGLDGQGVSAWHVVEEPEEVCVSRITQGRLDRRRLPPRQSAAPRLQKLVLGVNPRHPCGDRLLQHRRRRTRSICE